MFRTDKALGSGLGFLFPFAGNMRHPAKHPKIGSRGTSIFGLGGATLGPGAERVLGVYAEGGEVRKQHRQLVRGHGLKE